MPERQTGRKAIKIVVVLSSLVFLAIAAAILVGGLFIIDALDAPTGTIDEKVLNSVFSGESAVAVARRLQEASAIRSAELFRLLIKIRGQEQKLKTGTYLIGPDLSGSSIADLIVSGQQMLVRVSIPEGSGLDALAEAAEVAGVATAASVHCGRCNDPILFASLGIPADP
jgi:UPF0755 protein